MEEWSFTTWVTGRSSWYVVIAEVSNFFPKTSKYTTFNSNTPSQAQPTLGIPLVSWIQSHAIDPFTGIFEKSNVP